MVKEERSVHKSRSFQFRKMFDFINQHDEKIENMREGAASPEVPEAQQVDSDLDKSPVSKSIPRLGNCKRERPASDMELMKERFAKLLLGEDMSGGGKGVSSALALSNAITNLAASVFGEQSKLEPMSVERKERWKKEVDWLLSVADYIVEFVPSQQKSKDGTDMEIMLTQQRRDLMLNIPALRKLDAMLIGILENFEGQQEFWYVSRDADESEKGIQRNDKWWLPTVKVPPTGLSEESRQFLQKQKEAVNQVLKASMAINAQILLDMEIPDNYIESLPKNGRSSLGEPVYKNITIEFFDPQQFLLTMDMSSEHKVLDLKNRIEASIVIWKRKMHQKDGKSGWGSAVSLEKRELFEERAETILLLLKHQFPGIPQSSLDISKIQYNKDVGLSILESYSRVLESLANTVMSRIEDVLYADSLAQDPSLEAGTWNQSTKYSSQSQPLSREDEAGNLSSAAETPTGSMTLSDFMGWDVEPPVTKIRKNHSTGNFLSSTSQDEEEILVTKPALVNIIKKLSYTDKIEMSSLRSPTSRH
ncbi:rho guanine nucleotide exchange factor 8-like isoform X1 [Primulina eburnea]|uniref:rho guanine nucleotide exchange factor 8-like isoform X1 n=1 Tax=Primulina eburnea TaxID=1245227 RepID=UPI003C6CB6BE